MAECGVDDARVRSGGPLRAGEYDALLQIVLQAIVGPAFQVGERVVILGRADLGEDTPGWVAAADQPVGILDPDRRCGRDQFHPPRRASNRRRTSWSAPIPPRSAYSVGVRPPKRRLRLGIFI